MSEAKEVKRYKAIVYNAPSPSPDHKTTPMPGIEEDENGMLVIGADHDRVVSTLQSENAELRAGKASPKLSGDQYQFEHISSMIRNGTPLNPVQKFIYNNEPAFGGDYSDDDFRNDLQDLIDFCGGRIQQSTEEPNET
jgi:hypothetical protein